MFPWWRGGGPAGGEGPAAQTVLYLCPSDTTQFDFPHKRSNNISVTVNYAAQKPIKGPSASTQPLLCSSACAQISRLASRSPHPTATHSQGQGDPLQKLPREPPFLHRLPGLPTKIAAQISHEAASLPVHPQALSPCTGRGNGVQPGQEPNMSSWSLLWHSHWDESVGHIE